MQPMHRGRRRPLGRRAVREFPQPRHELRLGRNPAGPLQLDEPAECLHRVAAAAAAVLVSSLQRMVLTRWSKHLAVI